MKKSLILILFFICGINSINAQKKNFVAGLDGNYLLPISELGKRFKAQPGFSGYFGIQTSEKWTWLARVEYFKFDKVNYNSQIIKRTVMVGSDNKVFEASLSKLNMKLEVSGLSLNAKRKIIDFSILQINADAGFGIYRWTFSRGAYDSVFVDTSGNSSSPKYYNLLKNIPGSCQDDWSGGFYLGLEFLFNIFENISISVNANYKAILGELWQALAFDMENVSSMQIFNIGAGIRYKF